MKRKFLYCVGLLFMLAFFAPSTVYASSMEEDTEYTETYDYDISNYVVDVKVNEDNSMDITEKLEVYFNVPKHGIYRKLPIVNQIVRQDGSTVKNRAKVSDVTVKGHEFTTSTAGDYYEIKIGSENKTVTDYQNYTIKYHYDIGRDTGDGFDELYFNLIGTEWDTTIQCVEFSIEMPKKFDEEKLGFSVGSAGSTDSEDVYYTVSGKKIEGGYYNILEPGQGLTVRLELPEGYFVRESNWLNVKNAPMFIVPAACLLLSFILWFIFGRDDKPEEKMCCYPPRGYNSLELGFLYKGKAKGSDVVSLLVYLANKGYLSIEESEDKALFSSSNECIITKLKEYDGDNEYERIFFNELFFGRSSVTITELKYTFYTTVDKILKKINDKKNVHTIMHKITVQKVLVVVGMLLSIVTAVAIPTLEVATGKELVQTLFIMAVYTPFYGVVIFSSIPLFFRFFMGVFVIIHSSVFFSTLPIIDAVKYEPFYLAGILFTLVCLAGMVFFFKIMPKRTPLGTEIYGEILGFKHYLETTEKGKLEATVMENPTYFYDILPYTYVLGISEAWIERFETITLEPPHWYRSRRPFRTAAFGTFFCGTMRMADHSMTARPSKSSGGSGSSGGGCSGGGSGGGGGGSW